MDRTSFKCLRPFRTMATRQGFAGMDFNDSAPSSFIPVAATATAQPIFEVTAMGTITNVWTGIAANDMRAGKAYELKCGGVFSTASTATSIVFTPCVGTSATLASNVSLGPSIAFTPANSLASVPWHLEFVMVVRSLGLATGKASISFWEISPGGSGS